MQAWKTLDRTILYRPHGGKYLTVESHRVELPDGQVIADWPWLITPDYNYSQDLRNCLWERRHRAAPKGFPRQGWRRSRLRNS